jgi:hypothetical protein
MDAPYRKTPPKSTDKIRSALESVRQDVNRKEAAGPFRDGIPADTRIVIASFHQPEAGHRFQEVLLQSGIMSAGKFHRDRAEISVDYSDCDQAAELLKRHLERFPDLPAESWRRDFDFAIFGSLMGATFGVVAVFGEFSGPRSIMVVLVFTLFGAVSGYCCDRPRNRYRRTGHFQFGIGDVLGLISVVGLAFFIWRLLLGR